MWYKASKRYCKLNHLSPLSPPLINPPLIFTKFTHKQILPFCSNNIAALSQATTSTTNSHNYNQSPSPPLPLPSQKHQNKKVKTRTKNQSNPYQTKTINLEMFLPERKFNVPSRSCLGRFLDIPSCGIRTTEVNTDFRLESTFGAA